MNGVVLKFESDPAQYYGKTDVAVDVLEPDCDMRYWKVENSILLEMSSEEKSLEDQRYLDNQLRFLRDNRNAKLSACDWTQLPDAPEWVTASKNDWLEYRRALRDITDVYKNLQEVVWPTEPDKV